MVSRLTILLYNPFWLKMFEHEYIYGGGAMAFLPTRVKERRHKGIRLFTSLRKSVS
jgi:hypothetical protein